MPRIALLVVCLTLGACREAVMTPPTSVLDGEARAILVDTRPRPHWTRGHAAHAVHVDATKPDFASVVVGLIENPDVTLYLYADTDDASIDAAQSVRREAQRARSPVTVYAAGSFVGLVEAGAPLEGGP